MYTVFGASTALKACLSVFAAIVATVVWFTDIPSSFVDFFRWASISANAFMILVWLVAGLSMHGALWRRVFRCWPKLNAWVFPDINGVWYGTTQSNWPVIDTMRTAASKGEALDLDSLATVPLREDAMAMEIKANLFRISIKSRLSSTGGCSKTLSCRADKDSDCGDHSVSYIYHQATPKPLSTDEGSHVGAATLEIALGEPLVMRGVYWTRRKWREGRCPRSPPKSFRPPRTRP